MGKWLLSNLLKWPVASWHACCLPHLDRSSHWFIASLSKVDTVHSNSQRFCVCSMTFDLSQEKDENNTVDSTSKSELSVTFYQFDIDDYNH